MDTEKALKQLEKLRSYSSEMRLAAEKWKKPWQTLIATILSARTRDEVTIPIAEKLFKIHKNPDMLMKASIEDIGKIIRPVNFYRNKTRNIINCSRMLVTYYNGRPPRDFNELLKLPGVGRKTANVFLSEMGVDAIGIDTHAAYISHKLGWTQNKNPKKIEEDLKRLFPNRYWKILNPILVRFGKTYNSRGRKNEILEKIRNIR